MGQITAWQLKDDVCDTRENPHFASMEYTMDSLERIPHAINTAYVFAKVAQCPVQLRGASGKLEINGLEIVVQPDVDPAEIHQDYCARLDAHRSPA